MLKPIKSILFATDLTANCQPAYDFTLSLAAQFQATIYLLHIIETLPDNIEGKLKHLLGKHQWTDMVNSKQTNVRRSLLGKTSANQVVRDALNNFCSQAGVDDDACNIQTREIIISDGDIDEEILKNAEGNKFDLIVLGGHRSLFAKTSIGSTMKSVLKNTKIPVTIVPSTS